MLQTTLGRLRVAGLLEGLSFLLLLFVAMPLKYLLGQPAMVKVVGWAHGVLFVLYLVALVQAALAHDWSLKRLLGGIVASVLPFGPFVFDRRLQREQAPDLALDR